MVVFINTAGYEMKGWISTWDHIGCSVAPSINVSVHSHRP